MRKKCCSFASIVAICLSLTGCDYHEVTDFSYVYAIGLDKGVNNILCLTIILENTGVSGQTQNNSQSAASSGMSVQQSGEYTKISMDTPSLYAGINLINTFLSRDLNYTHASYMVVSEKLAREGIGRYYHGLTRNKSISSSMDIIVTKCTARKFIEYNIPSVGTPISRMEEGEIAQSMKSGLFYRDTYASILNLIKSDYGDPAVTLGNVNEYKTFHKDYKGRKGRFSTGAQYSPGKEPRKGGRKTEFLGTALFRGAKMVGELNGDETRAMMMVKSELHRAFIPFEDPEKKGYVITFEVRGENGNDIKIDISKRKPRINIKLNLEGNVLAIQSTYPYEKDKNIQLLQKKFSKYLKTLITKTIKKCQKKRSDAFSFGEIVAKHFYTINQFEKYRWRNKFKNASVKVDVKFMIRNTGTMIKSVPLRGD